jgi:hypothetical protein
LYRVVLQIFAGFAFVYRRKWLLSVTLLVTLSVTLSLLLRQVPTSSTCSVP